MGTANETELLKQARVTKHQAKKIALARVKRGATSASARKREGVPIWSVDIAQPPKKNLTDVWVDATTGKITAVEVMTTITGKKEVAIQKAKKWVHMIAPPETIRGIPLNPRILAASETICSAKETDDGERNAKSLPSEKRQIDQDRQCGTWLRQ